MTPEEIHNIYSLITDFLIFKKISYPDLSFEFISNISYENLFSLFNEIYQRENIKWQEFYDYISSKSTKNLTALSDVKLVFNFSEKNFQQIDTSSTSTVNFNAIQQFDDWLYKVFNKFIADRILLYVKALYLYDHIDEFSEEFVRKPIIEIQGTLFKLIEDNKSLSDEERNFRRIIRDALYELLPDTKPLQADFSISNTLTPDEKIQAYTGANDFNSFYSNENNIAKIASDVVTNTINNIPLEFPRSEYQVADEYIDPRLALNLDRWMLTAGIVDSKSVVHPEMLFTNAMGPVGNQISNVFQIGILQKIYKGVLKKNFEESFKNSPIGLDPTMNKILADEFAKDLVDRVIGFTQTGVNGEDITRIPLDVPSPNVFEVGLAALMSIFKSPDATHQYVEYIVNKKLKEANEKDGLVDEQGMYHKGLGQNQKFNDSVFQNQLGQNSPNSNIFRPKSDGQTLPSNPGFNSDFGSNLNRYNSDPSSFSKNFPQVPQSTSPISSPLSNSNQKDFGFNNFPSQTPYTKNDPFPAKFPSSYKPPEYNNFSKGSEGPFSAPNIPKQTNFNGFQNPFNNKSNVPLQSFPSAFQQGFENTQKQFQNFNPNAAKLSQFDPYGNFKSNGIGNLNTPNIPKMIDNVRNYGGKNLMDSIVQDPLFARPSLPSQIGNNVGQFLHPNELANLQKNAFYHPNDFKNALFQSPFTNNSSINKYINESAPSLANLPAFRREAFAKGLSKSAQDYNKAFNRGPLSPLAQSMNNGIGRFAQGIGGLGGFRGFDPRSQPITNMAGALGQGAKAAIPAGILEMYKQQAAMQEAMGKRSNLMRAGPQMQNYAQQGAQYRNGSTSYLALAGIIGGVLSTGTVLGATAVTVSMTNLSNFFNSYRSFNQLGSTVRTNGAYEKYVMRNIFANMLAKNPAHPKAAYIQSLIYTISHQVPVIDPLTGLQAVHPITGVPITREEGTLAQDKMKASRFRAKAAHEIVSFVSHTTNLLQSYTSLFFGSRGVIDSGFAFYTAAHHTALAATTFARWGLFTAMGNKSGNVGSSDVEKLFAFFIGRHDDALSNAVNSDPTLSSQYNRLKDLIFMNSAQVAESKWWEFAKRWKLNRAIKKDSKNLDKLIPRGFNILGKGMKGAGYFQRAFYFISSPSRYLSSVAKSKVKAIAINTVKRFGMQIWRNVLAKTMVKFGFATFSIASGGIGAIAFALVSSTKLFGKLVLYFVLFIICLGLFISQNFVSFFSPIHTASIIGIGGGNTNIPENTTAKGILLSTALGPNVLSAGGLTISGLQFKLGFGFTPDPSNKISYPQGLLYANISTTSSGFTRAMFEASVSGTTLVKFDESKNIFQIDQAPVGDIAIPQKNYDFDIKIKDINAFSKFITKSTPLCMNFAYLTIQPTNNDLTSSNPLQVSKLCVDGNAQPIGGDFVCPVQPVGNKPLYCTMGSFECIGGTCTHEHIKAMDLAVSGSTPIVIVAPVNGTINGIIPMGYCGDGSPYGGQISILGDGENSDNRNYTFIHMSNNMPVSNGQKVTKGQVIGSVWEGSYPGFKGNCWTGAHVHTEVRGDSSNVSVSSQHSNTAFPEDIYNNLLKCNIPYKVAGSCTDNVSKRDEAK